MGMVDDAMRQMRQMEREANRMMRTMPYYMRPSTAGALEGQTTSRSGFSEVKNDEKSFQVNLDTSHFRPDEIEVKTVDNALTVEGRHEEKPDEHGFISRHFVRKYMLPKDVDPKMIKSKLSSEGILTIEAPKMAIEGPKENKIPIEAPPSAK